jgi:hypothetical protein
MSDTMALTMTDERKVLRFLRMSVFIGDEKWNVPMDFKKFDFQFGRQHHDAFFETLQVYASRIRDDNARKDML